MNQDTHNISRDILIESLPIMAWLKDLDGNYSYVNQHFLTYFNKPLEDIIGKSTYDIWPKDIADKLVEGDRIVQETLSVYEGDDTFFCEDGEERYFVFVKQPVFDDKGKLACTAGFRWEVTDRVKVEKNLAHRTDFQRVVMNLAVEFVNLPLSEIDNGINRSLALVGEYLNLDRVYRFSYYFDHRIMVNTHEWCAEGISPEIENLQALPMEFVPTWVNAHINNEQTHFPRVKELPIDHPVREILDPQGVLSIITLPLFYEGHCFGFVGFDSVKEEKDWNDYEIALLEVMAAILTNVEIRRIYENELVEAKSQAEISNLAKSEFLANMSHEIRTPLHGVVSMINLLKETELTKEQLDFLEMAESSSETLLNVINDILDFSKMEAGRLELVTRMFNLEDEISRIASINSAKAAEKNIELLVRFDPSAPRMVQGDNLRLRQVITNLVSNALKFTEKGHVLIDVQLVSCNANEATIKILVSDTGIGVPEDKREIIFEQFAQVDGSSSRRYGGTGLGLAICRQLLALMGSDMELTSELGEGSTFSFTVTLPWIPTSQLSGEELASLKGLRALIVDDLAINRRILSEYLTNWKVEHNTATNSLSALRYITKATEEGKPYDFILLDQAMPGMDGLELAKLLSSTERLSMSKVILMTSMWGLLNDDEATDMGIDAMLPKPIVTTDLLNVINNCLFGFKSVEEYKKMNGIHTAKKEDIVEQNRMLQQHVLVVDDHVINRKAATIMIEKLGYKVFTAENGLEAIGMLQRMDFDFIFMDIQIPIMDGFEATMAIRELGGRYVDIPIIALTANAMESDKEKCIAAGMTNYLSKPVEKDKLMALLKKYQQTIQPEDIIVNLQSFSSFNKNDFIERYGRDVDLASELLTDFMEEGLDNIQGILQAIEKNDSLAEGLLHRFKGACSYVSADRLKELCAVLMKNIKDERWQSTSIVSKGLLSSWEDFTVEVMDWLNSLRGTDV